MELFWLILAAVLILTGLIGSVLPVLPGPPLAYGGLLLMHFSGPNYRIMPWLLISLGIITAAVAVLDYLMPSLGTKYFGGSKYGSRGSTIGLVIGVFTSWLGPWGIIIGPFLGALIGELIYGQPVNLALKSATGSLLGFLGGTVMKVLLCLMIAGVYLVFLIKDLV